MSSFSEQNVTIRQASSVEDMHALRCLLLEYASYLSGCLGPENICPQSYEKELADLPGAYASPQGALLLAFMADEPAGCVAMKPIYPEPSIYPGERACEMKRLWVTPRFRSRGIGRMLAEALIELGRRHGYTAMYLDTIPAAMSAADAMYRKLGFVRVDRYYVVNPILINDRHDVSFYRCQLPDYGG